MAPYIKKQIKPICERVEAKLEQELIAQLKRYCEYLESDRDYVIAQALAMAFQKDKGFQEWQRSRPMPLAPSADQRASFTLKSRDEK